MAIRHTRIGKRARPTNVVEIYPSPSGGRRRRDRAPKHASAEDREPRAIRCYQCGQPIEDYAEIDACPFCDSDNMLGRKL